MTTRNGVCEFKSLAKSVELDTEWFRSVTSILPFIFTNLEARENNEHLLFVK